MARKPSFPLILLIFIVVILLIFTFFSVEKQISFYSNNSNQNLSAEILVKEPSFLTIDNATVVKMNLPAVDATGRGVLTDLAVEIMAGSGRILVDIDNLLFWADTQQSIKIARAVAENVSGINASNYDLVYNVYANASVIGGPSAGAAIAIATIAALERKPLNESVMITGTVNSDGSIGKVGDVFEKSQAAKSGNATLFLVPKGQGYKSVSRTTKECKMYGIVEICTIDQVNDKEDLNNRSGITIIEVKDIKDALQYFIK